MTGDVGDEAAKALILRRSTEIIRILSWPSLACCITRRLSSAVWLESRVAAAIPCCAKGELIVHQGQQGRDDQGQVGQCEGGQLITEGFPRASREDGCGALAGQQTTDHRFLPGPQAIKAEVSGQ